MAFLSVRDLIRIGLLYVIISLCGILIQNQLTQGDLDPDDVTFSNMPITLLNMNLTMKDLKKCEGMLKKPCLGFCFRMETILGFQKRGIIDQDALFNELNTQPYSPLSTFARRTILGNLDLLFGTNNLDNATAGIGGEFTKIGTTPKNAGTRFFYCAVSERRKDGMAN